MPTLEDGDLYVNESVAILRYLAGKAGEAGKKLYNIDDPREKARINEALGTINDWRVAQGVLAFNKFWAKIRKFPTAPEILLIGIENQFKAGNAKLNDFLAGKKYIALDRLTLADFVFVENWINGIVLEYDYAGQYPNIYAYVQGILDEIPSIRDELNAFTEATNKMKAA